jgi:tetratricopeptide (TPR) repeat protein
MDEPRPEIVSWLQEALAKQRSGNLSGALLAYRRVLSRDPALPDAWCNLASILHALGREDEALEACTRGLALAQDNPAAHSILGNILAALGEPERALGHYRIALALDPGNVAATSNLAGVLVRLGHLEEALAMDRAALALAPASPELAMNEGVTLMRLGRLEEAEPALAAALALAPGMPKARWNLAYLRLLQGRYRDAWPDFQARLEVPQGLDNLRGYAQPAWDGAPFPGKTLLVWVEQGLGDTLQFARYLPRVKALGGTVVFQTYTCLLGLLGAVPGADQVLGETAELPPFDLQVPLLDLPALFGSTLDTLPPPLALAPPQGHRPPEALARKLASQGRKAGLVWAGSPHHQDDARRSLPPALLEPLGRVPGLSWMSLQVGATTLPLPGMVDLAEHFRDFSDTAQALNALDLLVTVDTSVAHLAGSMGIRTHLLLPYFPDWRWLMRGRDCAWYPQVRLHRQPSPGAWAPVLEALAEELAHGA